MLERQLSKITIHTHNGMDTAWNLYCKNPECFSVKGVGFMSEDPKVINLFAGYKYQPINHDSISHTYLDMIHRIIANGDSRVSNYIYDWMAYIVQKPNQKPCTALVVVGG